ncbi:kinase-like protein [Auricularia subglabra TFB-10046 SS5]|nr:kinase-like protein [Auricularia subglabra TFB-10046 SS5]
MDHGGTGSPAGAGTESAKPSTLKSMIGRKGPVTTTVDYQGVETQLTVFLSRPRGQGGFGAVFEATLSATPVETVVVKIFPILLPTVSADEKTAKAPVAGDAKMLKDKDPLVLLDREIQRWRDLDHRRVLPFYGFCELGPLQIGIVSPYMENGNMRDFLARNATVDRCELVAEGVLYLHDEVEIVHGDLKCVNVLIGPKKTALLADFGLSTVVEETEHPTATWIRNMKTIAWAAPELFTDEAYGDPLPLPEAAAGGARKRSKTKFTDCYAFAMLVYETFTGQPPWGYAQDYDIYKWVVQEKRRPPKSDVFTDGVWKLCTNCWPHDPSSRLDAKGISDIAEIDTVARSNISILPVRCILDW